MIDAISSLLPPISAPPPVKGDGRPDVHTFHTNTDGEKPANGTGRPAAPLLAPASVLTAQQAAGEQKQLKPGRGDGLSLSDEERAQVETLKKRDREVREHERAHASAGGQYAGSPSYSYETGPDGRQYAVEGEVPIDSGAIPGDPEATMEKMNIVIKAALAPAEPSAQDRKVAAQAQAELAKARAELAAQNRESDVSTKEKDRFSSYRANSSASDNQSTKPDLPLTKPDMASRAYETAQSLIAIA